MYYLFSTIFLLIETTQKNLLKLFTIETLLNRKINEFPDLYQLLPTEGPIYIQELQQHHSSSLPFFGDTLRLFLEEYWEKIRNTGLGLSEIDNIIVLIILIRFIILSFRYNILTSFTITTISTVTGYLWYSTFLSTLFVYENALYKNALTFRLGVDANQIRRMMQAKIRSSDHEIRLTNPIGVLAYAFEKGSVHEGYKIDPLSMVISTIPNNFPKHDWIEGTYYLWYRKLIPTAMRAILDFVDAFTSYAIYTVITRVNKRYCPYLIRWHWTLIILLKFFEPYFTYLIYRINDYSMNIVYPAILEAQEYGINLTQTNFELVFLNYICFTIIIIHLTFLLFAMLHALCGQYFYIPFITENVELHIGERNKLDKYSGGYTAWQDEKLRPGAQFRPKLWYGWFGKGTKNDSDIIFSIVQYTIKIITVPFISLWKLIRKNSN